jgi:hypothetical protein
MSIITCSENGHKYDSAEYENCPYCPQKTVLMETQKSNSNFDKTKIISDSANGNSSKHNKTEILSSNDSSKTAIHQSMESSNIIKEQKDSLERKLVGWLVTFSSNSAGDDYQLREGKTIIGGDSDCDISLKDNEVSGKHATILYRKNKFRIKDELSTNGTRLNNDIDLMGEHEDLDDGDRIIVGKTEFLFRKI